MEECNLIMKKFVWTLAIVLVLVLPILAGCTGGEQPAPSPAPTTAPKPVAPAASTPAPTPTATEPEPTAAAPATVEAVEITHALDGRDNCGMCHDTGIGDATKTPDDHAGRSNDDCTACHKVAE